VEHLEIDEANIEKSVRSAFVIVKTKNVLRAVLFVFLYISWWLALRVIIVIMQQLLRARIFKALCTMQHVYGFLADFDRNQVLSSFVFLFASLNTLGNTPIILNIKRRIEIIDAPKVTLASGIIMIVFLFGGRFLLDIFCIDDTSFAVAGSVVLFLIGLEMILGVNFFQIDTTSSSSSVAPLAFPMIAGAGTMVTLITLRMKYAAINIFFAILGNLVLIYLLLCYADWIERKLGSAVVSISQKVMGLILMAMAIKLVRAHLFVAV